MKTVKIIHSKYTLKFDYYANDDGSIYSTVSNKTLNYQLDKDGYAKVQLMSIDGKRHRYSVHRLILENFQPCDDMDSLQVNHIDGNKLNNKLENLEWTTASENNSHKFRIGLASQKGEHNNASKLTEAEVKEIIILLLAKQYTYSEIASFYHVDQETIGAIKRKSNWQYLTQDIDFN